MSSNKYNSSQKKKKGDQEVLPVNRSKEQAKKTYDLLSRFYDYLIGFFEKRYRNTALDRLRIRQEETVLEIGFGTGQILKQIAERVGEQGKAYGIDISRGMMKITAKRIMNAGLADRVELYHGDASELTYRDNTFDAVFISFTLELFETSEIPKILEEIKRVLKPQGRLGLVSLSREYGQTIPLKLYEWLHKKSPRYFDCRPIYVEKFLTGAGYNITSKEKKSLFGLPLVIATAIP